MKTFLRSLTAAGCLGFAAATLAAGQPPLSLDQLLAEVRSASAQSAARNQQREQQFLQQGQQQAAILAAARKVLADEKARNQQLQAQYDAGQQQLQALIGQLRTREGDFGPVFDSARQVAGHLKTTLDHSLVSAQYPGRGVFLARMAESRDLPSLDDLRKLWFLMQQELVEEGKVAKFPATLTREDGTEVKAAVVRVGVFDAVSGSDFLRYLPETGALVQLNRQPASRFRRLAAELSNATGGMHPMAIDPTGGTLLAALVGQPGLLQRIAEGKTVGWIIIVLGIIGLLIVIERAVYLFLAGRKMNAQLNSSKPDLGNPLGRILTVFNEARSDDLETLELRLDEAILKERPIIEARLGFLRTIAVIGILLGLLGTVLGVMNTFQAMNLYGGSTTLIASGVSAALVSTWLGLLVAVVMLFCHSLLANRGSALIGRLEEQAARFIAARAQNQAAAKAAR